MSPLKKTSIFPYVVVLMSLWATELAELPSSCSESPPRQPHIQIDCQDELDALSDISLESAARQHLWRNELDNISIASSSYFGSDHQEADEPAPIVPYGPIEPPVFQHPLATLIDRALTASRRSADSQICNPTYECATYLLRDKTCYTSTAAESVITNVGRTQLRRLRLALTEATLLYERLTWANIERAITVGPSVNSGFADSYELVCYIEFSSYDGVDLCLKTKGDLKLPDLVEAIRDAPDPPPAAAIQDDALISPPQLVVERSASELLGISRATLGKATKILHSQGFVTCIVRFQGILVIIRGNHLSFLQASDRSTSECLVAMLKEQEIGTAHRELFRTKLRLAVTDGAAYNKKTERCMVAKRVGWSSLLFFCEVHILSGVFGKTHELSKSHISGTLAWTLSINHGTELQVWRLAVRMAIRSKLKLVYRPPSKSAIAFKELVIKTFVSETENELATALRLGATGNWTNLADFEFLARPGDTLASAFQYVDNVLVSELSKLTYPHFPKHRWTGQELSLKPMGILTNLHDVAVDAYSHYLWLGHGAKKKKVVAAAPPGGVLALEWLAAAPPDGVGVAAEPPDDWGDVSFEAPSEGEKGPPMAIPWAEENRRNRGATIRYLQSRPGRHLLELRLALNPMGSYRDELIRTSGEINATVECAKSIRGGEQLSGPAALLAGREWPLLKAATGERDRQTMRELEMLHDRVRFDCYPDDAKNVRFRHRVFRVLSREAATTHCFMLAYHEADPFPVFRLAVEPEYSEHLLARCEPSRGEYFRGFLERHADITSDDARVELAVVIVSARVTTVPIEHANSSIVRKVSSKSMQTHRPDLITLSAEHVQGCVRLRERLVKLPAGYKLPRKSRKKASGKANASSNAKAKSACTVNNPNVKRVRGGGGAWRAFISARCKGIAKAMLGPLALEYGSLSLEEKQAYVEAGAFATRVHRSEGGLSFGLVTREAARVLARDCTSQRSQRLLASGGVAHGVAGVASLVEPEGGANGSGVIDQACDRVKCAKVDRLLWQRIAKQRIWDAASVVASHRRQSRHRDLLVSKLPMLASASPGFHSEYLPGVGASVSWTCPVAIEVPRLVAQLAHDHHEKGFDFLINGLENRSRVFFHNDQEPQVEEPRLKNNEKPTCLLARTCICGNIGDLAHKAWLRFRDGLKKNFKSDHTKKLLEDGFIVARFAVESRPGVGVGAVGADIADEVRPDKFYHLSYLHGNPYFVVVRELACPDTMPDPAGSLHLVALHKYHLVHPMMKMIVFETISCVRVKFYSLVDVEKPLHSVNPVLLEVKETPNVEDLALILWKPPTKRDKKTRLAAGWRAALDNLPSDDSAGLVFVAWAYYPQAWTPNYIEINVHDPA